MIRPQATTTSLAGEPPSHQVAASIRVRGLVQGVGFRPTVWRLAARYDLQGWVANDGEGVRVLAQGSDAAIQAFISALSREAPPLARVDAIEHELTSITSESHAKSSGFRIAASETTAAHTGIVADAATCAACIAETFDPTSRRYRYPFTNCTHCGPRLSIIESIPYDRAATTMRTFPLCAQCEAEYRDPSDRRFHAQPIACPACGPRTWLERADGRALAHDTLDALDAVDAACMLIEQGHIVAVKGLGGFQLACDGCNETAVARLRRLKRRVRKPFALMARDLEVVRGYCRLGAEEIALLQSPAAPIVLLEAHDLKAAHSPLAPSVAPGVRTIGFMLANTPLHHLLMHRLDRPIVLTSGNVSDEPQCITDQDARLRLGGIAEYFLLHDRPIARRVDDSVAWVTGGAARVLRRARGYAPVSIQVPRAFRQAPATLAMGGELKSSFCLLRDGAATLSHHIGDLEEALTFTDYPLCIDQYLQLFQHEPWLIAVDLHPEYLSRKLGEELVDQRGLTLVHVQHHHAHIASCLVENGVAPEDTPVLGMALDGLGYGEDGTLWGGEFLLADYRRCRRLGALEPIAMPGGERAIHEPWRCAYASLTATMSWPDLCTQFAALDLVRFLQTKPLHLLDEMIRHGINSPLASSCGRLFDAAAAAVGICREQAAYEGQPAIEFEALVDPSTLHDEDDALAYVFQISERDSLPLIRSGPMWDALLTDLASNVPVAVIAARFHKGLAAVLVRLADKVRGSINTVALSGGAFQNRVLLEQVMSRLQARGLRVLTHRHVPTNDGGLALGQAAVAVARASQGECACA